MVVPTETEFQKALLSPLIYIQNIFEDQQKGKNKNDPINFVREVQNEFSKIFASDAVRKKIPSLSEIHSESSFKLIRWRCMIQDTNLDNEVLPSQLRSRDGKVLNGLFGASISVGEEHDTTQHGEAGFSSLITMCGVSLPAQSDWSKAAEEGLDESRLPASSKSVLPDKLPRGEGMAILLKLYDEDLAEKLQVTQIIDVLGVLDQSSLPNSDWTQMGSSNSDQDESSRSTITFPTLHVIALEQDRQSSLSNVNDAINTKAKEEILKQLQQSVGGDRLVAEWIFLAICARIHTRSAAHILGSLSINICGYSNSSSSLLATLRSLLPFVADQSLDLNHLNAPTTKFAPQSDADEKGLRSGRLQLVKNTCLFIDESTMNEGQLRENGINNIRSLSNVLQTQKLAYSFPFSSHEMESELQCIVVSQGKSFLPIDVQIPWQGSTTQNVGESSSSSVQENSESLQNLRKYLQIVQKRSSSSSTFTIPNEISEKIQEDFVSIRKSNQDFISANANDTKGQPPIIIFSTQEDLARIIQIARLICLTNGETSLRWEDWEEAKRLEQERLQRFHIVIEKA